MIRLSCAVAASTVSSQLSLGEASQRAEQQVQEVVRRLSQYDNRSRLNNEREWREQFQQSLQELIALSEFSRVLANVPQRSVDIVRQNKSAIAQHLPKADAGRLFEQTIETNIVPTNFEQPAH